MAKRASVSLTGGYGHEFDDEVAASFLTDLLSARPPLEESLGSITRIDWQTQDAGSTFDDQRLTLASGTVVEISVKSGKYVTGNGFPSEARDQILARWDDPRGGLKTSCWSTEWHGGCMRQGVRKET